jgi:ribonucleoside-diphosphate reductase alpha chain
MQKTVAAQATSSAGSLETTTPQASSAHRVQAPVGAPGLEFERFFSREGIDPFDEVEWEMRRRESVNEEGELFRTADVEIPRLLVAAGTNIVVSKYFRGQIGTPSARRASSS